MSSRARINDSGAIVGNATSSADGQSHGVVLVPCQITNVISDQLHGIEVNKFPTPFAGAPSDDPNNPMIMSTRSSLVADIAAVVKDIPSSFLPKMLLGVRKAGTTTILNSTPIIAAPGRTYLSFFATDGQNLYEVVAGYDSNGNGILEPNEVSVNFGSSDGRHNRTFVITANDWQSNVTYLGTLTSSSSTIFGGVAANLLGTFLNPTQTPSGASSTTTDLFSTETIHPLGANWSTNGDDNTVHFYTFPSTSSTSQEAATSNGVHQLIAGAITDLGANSTVEGYFAANPTVTSHTFGPYNFSGSINFNDSDPGFVFSDLGYAFGTVSISGQYSFTVSRTSYALTNVTYSGSFTDIYNYNYYRTDELGLNKSAAIVESGYPNLGQAGFVFENQVNFIGSGSNTTIFGGTFDF